MNMYDLAGWTMLLVSYRTFVISGSDGDDGAMDRAGTLRLPGTFIEV